MSSSNRRNQRRRWSAGRQCNACSSSSCDRLPQNTNGDCSPALLWKCSRMVVWYAIESSCQACLEHRGTALIEVRAVEVAGRAVERMEKGARKRSEDRWPAQKPKQRIDQRVLDVMHHAAFLLQMRLDQ